MDNVLPATAMAVLSPVIQRLGCALIAPITPRVETVTNVHLVSMATQWYSHANVSLLAIMLYAVQCTVGKL